ncbi:MAG TPA: hypothetical protein VFF70_02345 [Anaerolineae bacterium]|jgi:hypothetical protein|nr:hypothetical protein [Anaerolineae bacterium]
MNILKKFWAGWKRFGHLMGDLLARVVLTIFYFTIFLPFGLLTSLFGDPLNIRSKAKPAWLKRETGDRSLVEARRQF